MQIGSIATLISPTFGVQSLAHQNSYFSQKLHVFFQMYARLLKQITVFHSFITQKIIDVYLWYCWPSLWQVYFPWELIESIGHILFENLACKNNAPFFRNYSAPFSFQRHNGFNDLSRSFIALIKDYIAG